MNLAIIGEVYLIIEGTMKIRTNEKTVNMLWVREVTALILLDEHEDKEMLIVEDTTGKTLFAVSFLTLKQLRAVNECTERINNNYSQRRAMIQAQLAAGGNPS